MFRIYCIACDETNHSAKLMQKRTFLIRGNRTLSKRFYIIIANNRDYVKNIRTQNGLRKYSSSPGSYLKMFQQLDFWWEKNLNEGLIRSSTVNIDGYFRTTTFIPTTSALDLPTSNLLYSDGDLNGSPFDQIYRHNSGENLKHMQISDFLQNRLEESVDISKNWYVAKIISSIL